MEHAKIGAVSNLMNRNFYFAILLLHVPTRRATYTYNNKALKTLYELILQFRVHWPSATTNNELRLKHVSISYGVLLIMDLCEYEEGCFFLFLDYVVCRTYPTYIPYFTYVA